MNLGLCMVVRDEAHQVRACLAPIIDLFEEIAVIDMDSRDGTADTLRRELGIVADAASLRPDRCNCLCDARAQALARLSTPWVMVLDADERVERETLARVRALPEDATSAGYFGRWMNHLNGAPPFEDYKLFLFRRGLRPVGLVHDVVQHDIRARGQRADWLEGFTVQHFPDETRRAAKTAAYRERLNCAIAREPDCIRYHWFLGYMDFLEDDLERAMPPLERAAAARSRQFPVESLNSAMVLAEIHARRHDRVRSRAVLDRASAFLASVAQDFEVAVNVRLGPWLAAAQDHLRADRLDAIRAYRFAC
jgi:glycosyltransferase involved in cell wall biosynthesis